MTWLIGIDVGGTNLRVGVVERMADRPPRLVEELRFHADFSGLCQAHSQQPEIAWQAILSAMTDAVNQVRKQYPQVAAVGIGFPGFIDPHTQMIAQSPNLPGLRDVDLSADLSAMLQLPVVTENDALAAAYGEYVIAPTSSKHLLYLGLGTGVGGGMILNGQPVQGQHGVAMEVGHLITEPQGRLCGCGNHGCMEKYASATGVSISYAQTAGQQLNSEQIAKLAEQGDANAIEAFALAGRSLAQALAHIVKVIDIGDIVIGGGMSSAWPLMVSAFNQQLDADLIPVLRGQLDVRISSMGDQAGVIGAAMLAAVHPL